MVIRKRMVYYIAAVIVMEVMCMLTGCVAGDNVIYSVFESVMLYSKEAMTEYGITIPQVMNRVDTYWMYIIMSVSICIPTISLFLDEINSKMYMGIQQRKGTKKYILSKISFSVVSGISITIISLLIFQIALLFLLPDEGLYTPEGMGELLTAFATKSLKLMLFGGMMSLFGIVTAILHRDILFDLSLVFMLAYFTSEMFINDIILFPVVMIGVLSVLSVLMWKYRSKRI
ncbi:MAG: hypothetical protein E7265_02030 [Lachnospiraceae bacterium]|nr:hypothetical protein [Lachnospiraceae bacterium]